MHRPLILALLASATLAAGQPAMAQSAPAPAAPAAEASAKPMDAAERKAVIEELASKLKAEFVFPEVGARYAAMLRANLAKGAYDRFTDPDAFSKAVTADLQAVAKDGHLQLATQAYWEGKFSGGDKRPALVGLVEAKMIGHVAYLDFDVFPNDPAVAAKARQFLIDHAGETQAVIIDARRHHGGNLLVMNAILPLFYDRETTLVRMDTRAASFAGLPPETGLVRRPSPASVVRQDHVIEPDKTERRLEHVPVYYLTSAKTASAAEHLALAFRHTHRAVQIGETTRGAGHFGGGVEIGDRFGAFIPLGRTYDPDTGWDWEGKGVAPDVAVPADQALDEALKLAKAKGVDTGQ